MSGPPAMNRDRILEAIDQLRHRKARPDIQRICGYLFRRYHTNSNEAKADLDWCVANNVVLRVEYKGSISYRNAAKKYAQMKQRSSAAAPPAHPAPPPPTQNTVSKNFMELLTNVFGELVVDEPDYLELGVPPKEIVDNILSKDSVRYTRNYVAILLLKEVDRGNLIKLPNGNYLLGPHGDEKKCERKQKSPAAAPAIEDAKPAKKQRTVSKATSDAGSDRTDNAGADLSEADERKSSDGGNVRSGGRRKKAKKVFDPSDTHVPKKRGRPAGSLNKSTIERQMARNHSDDSRPDSRTSTGSKDQHGVCSVCHVQSKRGPNDRMVACRECSNKAHFSCLNGDDMMLKMYPDNTWQCPHCKTCVVCFETSDAGTLTVCSVCADAYHAGCHQPRIGDKAGKGHKWLCVNCQRPDELKINAIQSSIGDAAFDAVKLASRSNSPPSSSDERSPAPSPTPPPRLSPQTNLPDYSPVRSDDSNNSDWDVDVDPSIPDATHWTPAEVSRYFAKYFPDEARIFQEQEIDGRSLLLLKRMDVLTNLNLQLGPALKIYRRVTMLQVRRDDPSLYLL
ncbi:uncharacterized protein LOC132703150 [Cylas formicarius]|uniref:uncharacterized protein LOC132703150 n=1 Tax=Cylas formicarius TaxID=197179 RepID=UPI002958A801|nr:uncharacterized protein LOC132703150 [Cylas formicarius]XP_060528254.1 uncharacterized protein LOC132703150 [Cylas formicarius]